MTKLLPQITGWGYEVPEKIRTNDDPIFDWLKKHDPKGSQLFQGYQNRHVLTDDEDLMTIMVPAAEEAIKTAGINISDIDLLIGTGSISEYISPNQLYELHHRLQLSQKTLVIPHSDDFSNFNSAIWASGAMLGNANIKTVLVVVGGCWTRYVNYHTPQSISAADGAGAVVMQLVESNDGWTPIDVNVTTESKYYGSMFMQGEKIKLEKKIKGYDSLFTNPFFQITEDGINGFHAFGEIAAPEAVKQLLSRNNLEGSDISLIAHQASSVLIDKWQKLINPAQYINTIEKFANMTVANIPVNFAWSAKNQPIEKDHMVFLALGPAMHAHALLLKRGH